MKKAIKSEQEEFKKFNNKKFETIKKVLIVSSNENVVLKKMLAVNNIEPVFLANGIDAIEILKSSISFDFAIIDYRIPYLNGLDLIKYIRENLKLNNEKLPIVALHSISENGLIKQVAKDLDLKYNLIKPLKIDELYNVITKIQCSKNIENCKTPDLSKYTFNIVIAEDDPVIKFITKTTLEKVLPKARIIEVNNGQEVIDIYEKEQIDLILMDIQMPILNGIEATEIIRKKETSNDNISIIALSGKSLKGDKEYCISKGMNDYYAKPLKIETMEKIILDHLVNIPIN